MLKNYEIARGSTRCEFRPLKFNTQIVGDRERTWSGHGLNRTKCTTRNCRFEGKILKFLLNMALFFCFLHIATNFFKYAKICWRYLGKKTILRYQIGKFFSPHTPFSTIGLNGQDKSTFTGLEEARHFHLRAVGMHAGVHTHTNFMFFITSFFWFFFLIFQ